MALIAQKWIQCGTATEQIFCTISYLRSNFLSLQRPVNNHWEFQCQRKHTCNIVTNAKHIPYSLAHGSSKALVVNPPTNIGYLGRNSYKTIIQSTISKTTKSVSSNRSLLRSNTIKSLFGNQTIFLDYLLIKKRNERKID